jgi:hypothetical protein
MKKTMNVLLAASLLLATGSVTAETYHVPTGGYLDIDITMPEAQDAIAALEQIKKMATDRQEFREKSTEYLLLAAQALRTEMLKVQAIDEDGTPSEKIRTKNLGLYVMIPSAVLSAYYTLKLGAEYLMKLPGIGIKNDRTQFLFVRTSELSTYLPKDTELGVIGRRIGMPLNASINVAWRAFRNSPQLAGAIVTTGLAIYSAGYGATILMDKPVYDAFMDRLDSDIANLQQSLDLIRAARE